LFRFIERAGLVAVANKKVKKAAWIGATASSLAFSTYIAFRFFLLPAYEWNAGKIAVVTAFWTGALGIADWGLKRIKRK